MRYLLLLMEKQQHHRYAYGHVVVEVWSKSHDLNIRPHRKMLTDRILQISVVVWSKFLKN